MEQLTPSRRYFDNAATSFPKPPAVYEAVRDYLENIGASAGRGAYREALESGRVLDDCRAALRTLFHASADDQVIFTLNGTDALNLALKGLVRPGEHVVTTCLDHNSVLRPLSAMQEQCGVPWTAVAVNRRTTRLEPKDVERALREDTALVVINHASNVTGVLQPIEDVAAVCRTRGVPLLVDAAQSAGHVPIDLSAVRIDMLACPGHKGLLGPLGTGVLVLTPEMAETLRTVREGGTGSQSEHPVQPTFSPDKFEAGSHNGPGIGGLLAAVRWIFARGMARLRAAEEELCGELIERLNRIDGLRWYGPRDVRQRVGVFSIRLHGVDPAELAALLEERFGILTRSGLHCAPLAHQTIGTYANGGTTRLSLGPFLEADDIEVVSEALAEITRHVAQPA